MYPYYEEYLQLLSNQFDEIKHAIEGLSSEALDWVPGSDMNSMAILAVHTAGATRFWVGDIAGQDESGRVRDLEFKTHDQDPAALIARLDDVLAHCREVLEQLTVDDLVAVRESPRHDHQFTVTWALLHALEHAAQHAGHIQLTRQLWDQRA
jgi:uncharacterized damage-inducible protein DinB